jgi:hypothetical protein
MASALPQTKLPVAFFEVNYEGRDDNPGSGHKTFNLTDRTEAEAFFRRMCDTHTCELIAIGYGEVDNECPRRSRHLVVVARYEDDEGWTAK